MLLTCSRCHTAFEGRGLNISGPAGGHAIGILENNYETCPNCGNDVSYPNGTFSFDEKGIATLLSGPDFTREVLQELKNLTQQVKDQGLSLEEFKSRASAITPAAEGLAAYAPKNATELAGYLTFLLALILAFLTGESFYYNQQYEQYLH